MSQIQSLYAGKLCPLEPEGQQTGIYKQAVESAEINREGILGDQQADRRYHGGPEKALHQYALCSYQNMLQAYPQLADKAVPGSMGENISSRKLNDRNVCIGDIYRMGAVLLQVSQPRTPCWKINHRFDVEKLSLFIEQQRITGWYYRVLEPGRMRVGDTIELQERPNADISIDRFLQTRSQHRPALSDLDALIHCKGLNEEWLDKLRKRRRFLEVLKA